MFEVCRYLGLDSYSATQHVQMVNQVDMIRDLVLYFLKQGPYDGAGDIAVLCAYLGQLQKLRAALRDLKVAVSVDERDEEQLERTGLAGEEEIGFAQVQVFASVQWTPSKARKQKSSLFRWSEILVRLKKVRPR